MVKKKRRIVAIAMSLLLAISMLPGMTFAMDEQNLDDYTGLQQGTTSTRIYMLNCGNLETTFPAVFGDANEYTSRWNIKTDTSKTEYFDNYIMDTPDTRGEIEFVFSIGGSGMNQLGNGLGIQTGEEMPDGEFKTGVTDCVNIVNASGEKQPKTLTMIFNPHSGSGGGTGGGPSRAIDVIVKITPNTLNANETYKLVLASGLSSGRDALDKDIHFTFTTAPILAEQITLSDSAAQLKPGETKALAATVLPENVTDKNVTWTSSDKTVATVDSNGVITALEPGEAMITAVAQGGSDVSAACRVTVLPILAEAITLSDSALRLNVGRTKALTATVLPEDATNKNITWASDDETVATVDSGGAITAIKQGEATITAMAQDGSDISGVCRVTVLSAADETINTEKNTVETIVAKAINLNVTSLTLAEGVSSMLKATVVPERTTNKAIAWTTSNAKVATVSQNGTIKAVCAGNAVITATAKDGSGAKATCAVKVTPVFAKLSMKAASSGHDSVKLSWAKDKRADGYKVYRRTAENKNFKVIADTKKRNYVDKKLTTGEKYTYKVRAYRTIGGKKVYGSYSTAKSAKPIPAPAKAKVKAGKGKITVKWNPVPGAEKYVVYKSTQKNKGYYKARITVKTAFTDTDVKSGKTYYYKVRNYKTVKGKKIYGKYTKAFQVKVK